MAPNQRTPVVPTRVGRNTDGTTETTPAVGGVLIRLPQIAAEAPATSFAQRITAYTRGASFGGTLSRLSPGEVLRQMGSTATQVLLTRPKLIAGTTVFAVLLLGVMRMWSPQEQHPPDMYAPPEVELAEVLTSPPEIFVHSPQPVESPEWTPSFATLADAVAPAEPVANETPPQFAPSEFATTPPLMPPTYDGATHGYAPHSQPHQQPAERLARVPSSPGMPPGSPAPPPAPTGGSGVARFEGSIVPPALGSQP